MEGSGSVPIVSDPDPGGTKTYGFYGSGTQLVKHAVRSYPSLSSICKKKMGE
jgi:hypothetical protein